MTSGGGKALEITVRRFPPARHAHQKPGRVDRKSTRRRTFPTLFTLLQRPPHMLAVAPQQMQCLVLIQIIRLAGFSVFKQIGRSGVKPVGHVGQTACGQQGVIGEFANAKGDVEPFGQQIDPPR